ncbi:MAG TPA: protein-glutamate O-methyltransferase CheR, partial [Polyangiaceae bacterium]|nr:protein-glutamate O-methyltransferase CheR [Polyangiaceae bacterium]
MQRAVATQSPDAGYEFALTDADFEAFRELILQRSGISLAATKRSLLCGRLARRLRHFGFSTFTQYYQYVTRQDRSGSELRELINRITTNKTEFFRENHHFEFLTREVLTPLRTQAANGGPRRLRIWSAGCSTGEEPYSIAITIAEALPLDGWDVRILASDIDTEVLQHAAAGEYPTSSLERVPAALRKRWFTSAATHSRQFRIHPELRKLVSFRQINFISEPWPIQSQFDVIFCRNVTIYFNRDVQRRLYERFARLLRPDGFLVAGHSENLHWLSHLFTPQGSTVYRVVGTRAAATQTPKAQAVVGARTNPSAGPPPGAKSPPSVEPDA